MNDRLQLFLMNLIPKNAISRLVGKFAASGFSRLFIPLYARKFQINLDEAEHPLEHYPSLVEFFVRRLKPHLRPLAEGEDVVVSPVDGKVSQYGPITDGRIVQAKGVTYTVEELLGGDRERAKRYEGGTFLTVYLSPTDYHRIHTPLSGTVTGYTYVPGTLFPVNPFGVRAVAGLFAKNERLVTYFDTAAGEVALVKVGATIVGSVKVLYDVKAGTNIRGGRLERKDVANGPHYAKGEEVGRFEFGSTIILLFEPGAVELDGGLHTEGRVLLGQAIGKVKAQVSARY
ncbi:archaetidylserine decarboxylase [Tumebacillus flagellatus]|uniref:Phosphatidylserine decarboxylase proenzyme n=1 Tax=Tumebacillus flagellatus TaxID=1157490 RepID=A0A074LUG9_9BACL|nr:archaetidylserine decarboxylase [Tumebacillus flagellatus]KEO84230.1 phosphatidylserine decarboxylase [Tumebacillus flagellatus]